jgi:hypothetical protein
VSVIVGAVVGAAVTHALEPVRERVVYVDRPVATSIMSAPASSTPPAPALRVDDLPGALPSGSPVIGSVMPAPASPSARVEAERLLLDEARAAFASGDHDKALALLRRHEQRFRGGVLSEERDALTVRALAALGKKSEAAALGRAFVAKYPDSIMRPAVESAMGRP